MNGPIAQIAALTCYGNALLRHLNVPDFFPNNSTCQFCESITFVELLDPNADPGKQALVADTPDKWFVGLDNKNAIGIRLWWQSANDPKIPDRMAAGFVGGGGTWYMEAMLTGGVSELWVSKWEVGNQNAPDRKIWRVTYGLIGKVPTSPDSRGEIIAIKADLHRALTEIHRFSEDQDCAMFTLRFAEALNALNTIQADLGFYKDLTPPGALAETGISIFKAATLGWVFGGMGSWNDMGFDGETQKEYERVSENLFFVINQAIAVAATSSLPIKGN